MKNRKDGIYIPETDPMHAIMPFAMPNRADNEALVNETVDLTAVTEYLKKKNADSPEYKYTFFHIICAAIAKTITLRPSMNRFYAGYRLYERKELSLAFTVKRKFCDSSDEVLALLKIDRDSDVCPTEQIYEKTKKIVYGFRKENKNDGATDAMSILKKLPRPILRFVMNTLNFLDYHGKYPNFLMDVDPYFSTVFVSNLGSIKMSASYHHLANRGTNSIFVVIGEKKPTPFFNADGTYEMRDALTLGITIDERIADGYYFTKSIKILKHFIEHPELLELPIKTEVEI